MFQKQLSLFIITLMFMSCGDAKPVVEIVNNEKIINTDAQEIIIEDTNDPKTEKEKNPMKGTVVHPAKKTAFKEDKPDASHTIESKVPKSTPVKIIEVQSVEKKAEVTPVKIDLAVISHDQWNTLLQKYVSATGTVNYKGFKSDNAALQAYLDHLAANPIQKSWPRNEKMAYWINAYNAFTVKLIIDNYPVSSIMKLNNGKPWDKKWIKLGAKTYSLNQIENDILRPKYKDARIHFAVNCAAKSCPPLLNKAWTADNLEKYFEQQATNFINNSDFNVISEKSARLSNIFEWYAADFGDLVTFLNKYSKVKIKPNAKISYMDYNWALNE